MAIRDEQSGEIIRKAARAKPGSNVDLIIEVTDSSQQKSPFGELVVAEPTPVLQIANKYAIDPANRSDLEIFEATGGSADNARNMFRCQTGTSVGGYGVIRTKDAVIYKAGESIEGKVTATFTTGIANSIQFAGLFSLTETVAFGYDGADFSTIYSYDGEAEVQHIDVTVAATSAANCTVTLDGDSVAIPLSISTTQTNAEEIRAGLAGDATLSGKWRFEQVDSSVHAISKSVGDKTGTMSFDAGTTGATATLNEHQAGVAKTDSHTAQADWNITSTPFTGFDPTKLNLYKVEFGYLGIANIDFSIYDPNTGTFVMVHSERFANVNTTPNLGSPDLKIGWTAASLGSSGTNLIVTGGSAEASVIGKDIVTGSSFAGNNSVASVATTLTNIITLKNRVVFDHRFNLGKIQPVSVSVENDHNKGAIVEVIKNADLGGTTNYQYADQYNSIGLIDKAGGTVTNGNIVDAFVVSAGGAAEVDLAKLSLKILPEDTLTVAVKTVSGTSTAITAAIVWKETK